MSSSLGSCETARITLCPSGRKASTASSGMPSIQVAPRARHAVLYSSRGSCARVLRAPRDQVVLDAAPGDRAHEDAVVAHGGERAGRARARAESLRDGEQPHAPAGAAPFERALEDVEIEALHRSDYTANLTRAKTWSVIVAMGPDRGGSLAPSVLLAMAALLL